MPHDRQLAAYRNVAPNKTELWMATHEPVYQEFALLTWEGIMAGATKLGSKQIAEVLRWNSMISKQKGDAYKVNNSHVTAMAKRFVRENPQVANIFNFRESK